MEVPGPGLRPQGRKKKTFGQNGHVFRLCFSVQCRHWSRSLNREGGWRGWGPPSVTGVSGNYSSNLSSRLPRNRVRGGLPMSDRCYVKGFPVPGKGFTSRSVQGPSRTVDLSGPRVDVGYLLRPVSMTKEDIADGSLGLSCSSTNTENQNRLRCLDFKTTPKQNETKRLDYP